MDSNKKENTIEKLAENKNITKKIAKEIEKGIHEFAKIYSEQNEIPFLIDDIYDTKLAEIIESLSDNPELIKNDTDLYNLAFLCPEELNPNKYDSIIKKKEINEYKKNDIKSSTAFKCTKCKKNKCSVSQKQILAGDEPLTTFVTCLECGYSFSFH